MFIHEYCLARDKPLLRIVSTESSQLQVNGCEGEEYVQALLSALIGQDGSECCYASVFYAINMA